MKVLCVGGAGYLGGAVTDIIGSRYDVRVYDNLLFEEAYRKNVNFTFGDIREHKKLKALLKWADCVVWLAALVGDGACAINPLLTKELNQDSVEWLSNNFGGRIIFMSTCSVYGARDGLLTEDSPTNPLSEYAITKLQAESFLQDKNAIIFRLGTLFGLGDVYSRVRFDLVVNTLTARAISEGKLTVFGGNQYRPLLHVKDAAQVIVSSLESKSRGIFNLHKENISILDLAKRVNNLIPCQIEIAETTFEDSRNYQVDSSKAEAIGFYPTYSVEHGISEIRDLLKQERIKDLNNPRYSNQTYLKMFHETI